MTSRVIAYRANGSIRDLACSDDIARLDQFADSYAAQGFRIVRDGPEVLATEQAKWEANPPQFREVFPGLGSIEELQADTPDEF